MTLKNTTVAQTTIRISQDRLALMLSISRQTANQLLKALEAQGAVRLQMGEIEIVDIGRLQQAAGLDREGGS